jgi:hypothetical protein
LPLAGASKGAGAPFVAAHNKVQPVSESSELERQCTDECGLAATECTSVDLGLTIGGGSGVAGSGGVGPPRVGLAHVISQAGGRAGPCSQLGSVVGGPAA